MFWLYVAAMIMLALAIILFTSRPQNSVRGRRKGEAILAVYNQQIDDLESDISSGSLTAEQAAIARLELEHTLLAALDGEEDNSAQTGSRKTPLRGWTMNGLIIVLLPILSLSLYYRLGQPGLAHGATAVTEAGKEKLPTLEELVAGLTERLRQTPDDEEGWWMLTRTYLALNRMQKAEESAKRLYKLGGDQADILLLYANVLIRKNDGNFSGRPTELIRKALALEPNNVSALWFAGLAAQQQADYAVAIAYWQKLVPLVASDKKGSQQVKAMLAQARAAQAGGDTDSAVSGNNIENTVAAKGITVAVSLSDKVKALADPNDTLFVFAKAVDGMPMPVAVARLHVSDLPATVVLNDSQAMMSSRLLSGFKQVKVGARISKSGKATARSGDLSSNEVTAQVGATGVVTLAISKLVP